MTRSIEWTQLEASTIFLEPLCQIPTAVSRWLLGRFDAHNWRMTFSVGQLDRTARSDSHCICKRFLLIWLRECCRHLCGTLDEKFLGIAHSRRVVFVLRHRNAAQRVMQIVIALQQKVRIVVDNQRQLQFCGDFLQQRIDSLLLCNMPLKLNIKTRLAMFVWCECACMPARFIQRKRPMTCLPSLNKVGQVKCDA